MLATQDSLPTLQDMLRLSRRFSSAERLYLAKKLLDSLVADDLHKIGEVDSRNSEIAKDVNDSTDDAVERERKAFLDLHPSLLKQYPGEHVAIYRGELIDHDKDALKLSLRVNKKHPNEFVWITPLKEQAIEEWVVRLPCFEPIAK